MKIIWTSKAEKHLTQIYDYIAEDSPYYASRTIERIVNIAENVSEHPQKRKSCSGI
ncbi:MAG: type II toxin-antitoxin system RelE/ParE family toxin [Bacteroidetes bacterium]|nr:type II toxin-antitoxin system RelE/ParE family toxin [Bacteroidota bacterium]